MTNIDNEQLIKSIEKLSKARPKPNGQLQQPGPVHYDFLRLGAEIAKAMVGSAESQVAQAQAMVEQTRASAEQLAAAMVKTMMASAEKRVDQARDILQEAHNFAEDLRQQVEDKDREMSEMGQRLEAFGATLREAHLRFCTAVLPPEPVAKLAEPEPKNSTVV